MLNLKRNLIGAKEMSEKIRAIAKEFPDRVAKALYIEAQIELTEMKKRTPVSPTAAQAKAMGRTIGPGTVPGTLRNSGKVSEPKREGLSNIVVVISFGGAGIDYAEVQHERLDFFHTTGQAKYMESVINESRPYMLQRIAARVHLDKEKSDG